MHQTLGKRAVMVATVILFSLAIVPTILTGNPAFAVLFGGVLLILLVSYFGRRNTGEYYRSNGYNGQPPARSKSLLSILLYIFITPIIFGFIGYLIELGELGYSPGFLGIFLIPIGLAVGCALAVTVPARRK